MNARFVAELLKETTLKTMLPVPVKMDVIYGWAINEGLSRSGKRYLYTGGLYQLLPYINETVKYIKVLERSSSGELALRAILDAIKVNPYIISSFVKPRPSEVNASYRILKGISRLVSKKVELAYLYEDDVYSGVLLYDMGLDDAFYEHAKKVYEKMLNRKATNLITVDPHTTYILREVYPKFIEGFDLEVKSYIEVLDELGIDLRGKARPKWGAVTIHDPCYYARYLSIYEQPRRLLSAVGVEIKEVRRSKKMTFCCGGPLEAMSPKYSEDIARSRMAELSSKSKVIVTMCPICRANLERVKEEGVTILDIAELLSEA